MCSVLRAGLAVCALLLLAAPSEPCSCLPTGSYPETACQAHKLATNVFAGTLLEFTPVPDRPYDRYARFSVQEGFKGATTGTDIVVTVPRASCHTSAIGQYSRMSFAGRPSWSIACARAI